MNPDQIFKASYELATGHEPSDSIMERFSACVDTEGIWNKDKILTEARKYPNLTAWQFFSWASFCFACKANMVSECTSHMPFPALIVRDNNVMPMIKKPNNNNQSHPVHKRKAS